MDICEKKMVSIKFYIVGRFAPPPPIQIRNGVYILYHFHCFIWLFRQYWFRHLIQYHQIDLQPKNQVIIPKWVFFAPLPPPSILIKGKVHFKTFIADSDAEYESCQIKNFFRRPMPSCGWVRYQIANLYSIFHLTKQWKIIYIERSKKICRCKNYVHIFIK